MVNLTHCDDCLQAHTSGSSQQTQFTQFTQLSQFRGSRMSNRIRAFAFIALGKLYQQNSLSLHIFRVCCCHCKITCTCMFGFFFQASCVYRMRTWLRSVWQPWPENWRPPRTPPSETTSSSFSVTSVLGKTHFSHISVLKLRYFHMNLEKPSTSI